MDKLSIYASESDSVEEDSYNSSSSSENTENDNKHVGSLVQQEALYQKANLQIGQVLQSNRPDNVVFVDEVPTEKHFAVPLAPQRTADEVTAKCPIQSSEISVQPLTSYPKSSSSENSYEGSSESMEDHLPLLQQEPDVNEQARGMTFVTEEINNLNFVQEDPNSHTLSAADEEDEEAAHSTPEQKPQISQKHLTTEPLEERFDQQMLSPQKSANIAIKDTQVPAKVVEDSEIIFLQQENQPESEDQGEDANEVEEQMISMAQQFHQEEEQNLFVSHHQESAPAPRTTDDVVVEVPLQVEESEDSELDQKLLKEQDSDQDFSDDQANNEQIQNEAFEEGSEDLNTIPVVNPILFTEHLPVTGRVPLMFFIPQVEERAKLAAIIEANGGRCVEFAECSTYQIRPRSKTELDFNFFYAGKLYDEQWIKDSIDEGYLQTVQEYILGTNDSEHAMKLNIGKRKKITIVEGMKLYKLLGAAKFQKVSNDTYKGIERQGILPERSFETMRNFWKEYSAKPLEQYLVEALFYKWDYCHSFKEIPNEEFESKHRKQFAYEFQQLEAQAFHDSHERQQEIDFGAGGYSRTMNVQSESSDDDPFNDKVTQKLDELQKSNERQFSVLEKLSSPENYVSALHREQETRASLLASGQTEIFSEAAQSKTMMIETSGLTTKAFDAGLKSERRIDLSSLIDDGTTSNKQNLPQLKSLSKAGLAGLKRTYNLFSTASSLCYNYQNRPFQTISLMSEKLKQKRFKRYTPRESEYPAYEPWEFAKQMEVEILEVKCNEQSFIDNKKILVHKHYRTVTRRQDDDGLNKWLEIELRQLATEYSRDFEDVLTIFEQVNCCKKATRERLAGETFCTWKKIEDLILQTYYDATLKNKGVPPPPDRQYQCLIDEKGLAEIKKRNLFLGLTV